MDDSCAVCAETLEWVAYGPCGHKDVCSTCVARLRFICVDRRCCICKTESNSVFVTKALGDYTRMIIDFSVLPSEVKEGRAGSYWYHEDTQTYFDDLDHYKMIKAMCRLSCGVCDKDEQTSNGSKRRGKFRNIEQLKGHLFHQHRLLMCSLCLEGRKVFICEQKLYTRAQLNQHINTGDSEVDGTESERGGFMGHPMCEFCRTPFYGENELYTHMSTDHYTCHICLRQHPGQYEYYKNYDDLETHFRQGHFLCEDEACLAKKFIVFQSEAEMKRHNTLEHGGRMSRSQRSAALQIPTSFRYRRSNEQDDRRGRGRTFRRDRSDAELSVAIQASLETANTDGIFQDPPMSNAQVVSDHRAMSDIDPIIQPFESLATTDSEPPSRYLQALSHRSRNAPLEESSFPPLPMAPDGNQQKAKHDPEGLSKNTMVEHLRRQKNKNVNILNSTNAWPAAMLTNKTVTVINATQEWPAASRRPVAQETSPIYSKSSTNVAPASSSSSGQSKPAANNRSASSSYSSFARARPASINEPSVGSSRSWGSSNRISHSMSAPNLVEAGSVDASVSDFPPVSAVQMCKLPSSGQAVVDVEDAQTANKSLVERIRAGLAFDQDKYTAFKDISGEYRQGLMDASTYLTYVEQFGLTHLVLELAKLCPDAQKQRELVETFNANSFNSAPRESGDIHLKEGDGVKKGKGKSIGSANSRSKDILADNVISTVQKLQSSYKPLEDEAEVLSKDGYRPAKGKSKVVFDEPQTEVRLPNQPTQKVQNNSQSAGGRSYINSGDGDVKSNQRKRTSKFHRARLGDGSMAALLDLKNSDADSDPDPDLVEAALDGNKNSGEVLLPVRGVWRNGGGHRLLSKTSRDPRK